MPLTDLQCRTAKPGEKTIKLFDGGGLFLQIDPSGGKWWRFKYRFAGKEKLISFGTYPEISLKEARKQHADARNLVANGIDPSERRRVAKANLAEARRNSFESVAREWHGTCSTALEPSYASAVMRLLERDFFPWLGSTPIAEIQPPKFLECLRRIEGRGARETAHRALQKCSEICRFGVSSGYLSSDPTRDLRGALSPVETRHLASITDPQAVGGFIRACRAYEGAFVTKCALRMAPLVFVRPGELRKAEWSEFDLDEAEWNIPAARMKMGQPHLVPLSWQVVSILTELRAVTGKGRFVFPSARSNTRPMSNNAILAALRRMGFEKSEMSGHGVRAMARTMLDERLQFRVDIIEHQLAHAVRDPNGRAYNRTAHLSERRIMMQEWADYLDRLASEEKPPKSKSSTCSLPYWRRRRAFPPRHQHMTASIRRVPCGSSGSVQSSIVWRQRVVRFLIKLAPTSSGLPSSSASPTVSSIRKMPHPQTALSEPVTEPPPSSSYCGSGTVWFYKNSFVL